MMIQKNELLIRLMDADDFETMARWLNDEKVAEFYEEPASSIDRVIQKYGPKSKESIMLSPV